MMKVIRNSFFYTVDSLILIIAWYFSVAVYVQYYPDSSFFVLINWLQIFLCIVFAPVYFAIAFILIAGTNYFVNKLFPNVKQWFLRFGVVLAFLLAIFTPLGISVGHYYVLGTSGRHAARVAAEQRTNKKAEKTIQQLYHDKGLSGKVKVLSAYKDTTEANYGAYDVDYVYTEKVNGKKAKSELSATLNSSMSDFDNSMEQPFESNNRISVDDFKPNYAADHLGATADKQAYVKKQYALEKHRLNQQLPYYLETSSIEYNLMSGVKENSPKFKELKQEVLHNRKQGLRLGGYYDLNIPKLARDGVFGFVVSIDFSHSAPEDYPQGKKKQENYDLALVQGMNFSDFWDGNYYFQFAVPDDDDDYYDSENPLLGVKATVQNGQLQSARTYHIKEDD